ncbi:hypothetical protein SAMN05216480_108119 [Pustulibacterium marinum]|uniref:Adhesin n=1 Tax=Pustulibacterium marinum TaxID=1224947 RepID=A0A1I7HCF6_9FLAO|nr:hypothetical protein [Pustulibacterium marinum]SFU58398.1 hypothetical protein SAMN05216480_108119 [Pustulibacterium marinum]
MKVSSQKIVEKNVFIADTVNTIFVDTENIFQLTINTQTSRNTVAVRANLEGEYAPDLVLTSQITAGKLFLGAQFQPLTVLFDDKLAAHKVITISLSVTIPENKQLIIQGKHTKTNVSGDFKDLQIVLHDGAVHLQNVNGIISVNTFNGDVEVADYNGSVNATSKFGEVLVNEYDDSSNQLEIKSVKGTITVNSNK